MDDFGECLAGARRGEDASFVRLFRDLQPLLLRYLTTLGGPLADDVASETWVSVVRSLDHFEGDERGWRSWVLSIAHARLRDAQRAAARAPLTCDEQELRERPGSTEVWAEVEELMSTERAIALLGRLPPDQAACVMLRHVVGLDVAATGEVVGKRAGAVRVSTHRGLRRLAELLHDAPDPEPTRSRPRPTPASTQEGCNASGVRSDH